MSAPPRVILRSPRFTPETSALHRKVGTKILAEMNRLIEDSPGFDVKMTCVFTSLQGEQTMVSMCSTEMEVQPIAEMLEGALSSMGSLASALGQDQEPS
ncbi:MAG TPA: hypothetical protein VJT85_00090 [Gemmatimonadaceae bacterium]|nr:hypothetical protein [Gemmatimonadaceae bacterium]